MPWILVDLRLCPFQCGVRTGELLPIAKACVGELRRKVAATARHMDRDVVVGVRIGVLVAVLPTLPALLVGLFEIDVNPINQSMMNLLVG
jgi:hypothetical protein